MGTDCPLVGGTGETVPLVCVQKTVKLVKGLEKNTFEEHLRQFRLFSLEKMMLKGNIITLYSYLQ